MPNKSRKILLLPGDGIGPEVVREVKKILEWYDFQFLNSLNSHLNQSTSIVN